MPRLRRGFTLIELLIVVVIIGILAAVAIPKFSNTKSKAFVAAMKSDLRNLSTAQEAYFYEKAAYAADTLALRFNPSSGVTLNIQNANAVGWGAAASHIGTTDTCAVYYGPTPVPPATVEGIIKCS